TGEEVVLMTTKGEAIAIGIAEMTTAVEEAAEAGESRSAKAVEVKEEFMLAGYLYLKKIINFALPNVFLALKRCISILLYFIIVLAHSFLYQDEFRRIAPFALSGIGGIECRYAAKFNMCILGMQTLARAMFSIHHIVMQGILATKEGNNRISIELHANYEIG
ncbi:hypothetical protein ACJX0J_015816, partial [Zea mays]